MTFRVVGGETILRVPSGTVVSSAPCAFQGTYGFNSTKQLNVTVSHLAIVTKVDFTMDGSPTFDFEKGTPKTGLVKSDFSDGSNCTIDNIPGFITYAPSNVMLASVAADSPVVTIQGNGATTVTATVDECSDKIYLNCNLIPKAGDIDFGFDTGLPLLARAHTDGDEFTATIKILCYISRSSQF